MATRKATELAAILLAATGAGFGGAYLGTFTIGPDDAVREHVAPAPATPLPTRDADVITAAFPEADGRSLHCRVAQVAGTARLMCAVEGTSIDRPVWDAAESEMRDYAGKTLHVRGAEVLAEEAAQVEAKVR